MKREYNFLLEGKFSPFINMVSVASNSSYENRYVYQLIDLKDGLAVSQHGTNAVLLSISLAAYHKKIE